MARRFLGTTLCALLMVGFWISGEAVAAGPFPPDQPFASFWFPNELLTWDPMTDPDAPYNRSAVPLQDRFTNPATEVNSHARPGEAEVIALSIMNPSTSNNPSQGSQIFEAFTFNYWQYVDRLTFWGGSAGEGLILAPNPGVIDAGHRNGVPVLGTIFLPPNVFGGTLEWVEDLVQRSGKTFPVADKLIEVAEYYGFDGWFINQETSGANAALASDYRDFIRYIRANSDLHIQWYDSMIESGPINWQNEFNTLNDAYIEEGGPVSDSMFLNFFWNTSRLANSRTLAQNLGHSPYEIYAGVDVQANGFNTSVQWNALFPEGNPHVVSLGFFAPNWTFSNAPSHPVFYQRANRFWVGANRDPSNTTTAASWKGAAHYVPAKSVIDSLPFVTHFNSGQGHFYVVDGVQLADNDWNNRGLQDILPTWRWIVDAASDPLFPELDWDDAYVGGTSLLVSGDLTSTNQLDLYKTRLPLTASSRLQVAFKGVGGGDPSHLSVGLAFEDGAGVTAFSYVEVGNAASSDWNLVDLDLSGFAGQTVAIMALRFEAPNTVNGYTLRIGRLAILDTPIDVPAPPTALTIDNGDEIDAMTASLRLQWTGSPDTVHDYQVYRRNGDDSRTHLGGTANTAFFAPRVVREGSEIFTLIEVEAVGPEYGRSNPVTKRFYWADSGFLFGEDFESGDLSGWSSSTAP